MASAAPRDGFGLYVESVMADLGLTKRELAKRSKISEATLYKLLDSQDISTARVQTILNLADALRCHPWVMFRTFIGARHQQLPMATPSVNGKYGTGFIEDVTIPDGSRVPCGRTIIKTWRVQNLGRLPWVNCKLVCVSDEAYSFYKANGAGKEKIRVDLAPTQRAIDIPVVGPSGIIDLSVELTAPLLPATVLSEWKMVSAQGELMFPDAHGLYCLISSSVA